MSAAVSPLAVVEDGVELGEDVTIGPFTVVHSGTRIGAGTTVGSHCSIGEPGPSQTPLVLGEGAVVRSHSVLYAGSTFGPELETGHRVTLREGLEVGRNLRVGTLSDLQGDATFGDFVRCHSNVHVGKHSVVGSFVWLFPYVVLTNDPHPPSEVQEGVTVEDYAVVATMSVVLPGVRVGQGSLVSAGAIVTRDVAPGAVAVGAPAKDRLQASEIAHRERPGVAAYPWRHHFHRGYPADVVQRWEAELVVD